MKNILKTFISPIAIATIVGIILGLSFYKTYKNYLHDDLSSTKLYLIQNGEYDNVDNMRKDNLGNNYVYYKINNKYKTVVGITNNYDNIEKIKNLYNSETEVTEYYIAKDNLDNKQYEYDKLLSETTNPTEVKEYVDDILKLYQNDNNLRLIDLN